MSQTIDAVYRDFNTAGVPASGDHQPRKPEIRALLKQIQNTGGQAVTRNTLTALQAVTPPSENYMGVVLDDPDATKNGYYSRVAGVWVFERGFPDSFAAFAQAGGTPNALQVVSASGVNPALVSAAILVPSSTNSVGGVTISVNGAAPAALLNAAGAPLAAGEIVGGQATLLVKVDGQWRAVVFPARWAFRGHWDNAVAYGANDLSEHEGSIWLAKATNTNSEPTDGADWALFLPGVTVADGAVTDAKLVPFGATSPSAEKLRFSEGGTGSVSQSIAQHLQSQAINIESYGAIGNGNAANATTNATALQRAVDRAVSTGRAIYIPPGVFVIGTTVNIPSKALAMFGAGEGRSTLRLFRVDGPMFRWTITGTNAENVSGSIVRDLRLDAFYEEADPYSNSAAFYIEGDNTCYFGYNRFQCLTVAGFYNGLMRVMKATQTTAFGQESLVTWNSFQSITLTGFTRPCYLGFLFDLGSGTGNSWGDIRSVVDGAVLRFEGGGCVVGDILLTHSHLGGRIAGAAAIWIGDSTVYRQRIAIVATQLDANLDKAFRLSSVGTISYSNITFNGNNVGGSVDLTTDIPPLRSSEIKDQEVSRWSAGRFYSFSDTGSKTLLPFTVTLGTLTGTRMRITVSGLVGGVSEGVATADYLIRSNGATAVVQIIGSASSFPAGIFSFNPVVSGPNVDVYVSCNPTSGGSRADVQIECMGGDVKVKRY